MPTLKLPTCPGVPLMRPLVSMPKPGGRPVAANWAVPSVVTCQVNGCPRKAFACAKLVMEGIVKDGQVTRGWIGVEPNDLSPELAETFGVTTRQGVIITGVLQNGPAAQAGIRPGDVITRIAERPVANVSELLTQVASLKPGLAARFTLLRREQKVELEVTPGVRPKPRLPAR